MLTESAQFTAQKFKDGVELHTVVEITDGGSNSLLFSDTPFSFGTGGQVHIYPLLKSIPEPAQEIDWSIRRSTTSGFTLELSNVPYGGDKLRASDRWSAFFDDVYKGEVRIYKVAGANATAFSDALLVWKGVAEQLPEYDDETFSIECADYSSRIHKVLPHLEVETVALTNTVDAGKRVPLFFSINHTGSDSAEIYPWGWSQGRFKAVRVGANRFYISDGYVASSSPQIWLKLKLVNDLFMRVDPAAITYTPADGGTYISFDTISAISGWIDRQPSRLATVVPIITDAYEKNSPDASSKVYFKNSWDTTDVRYENIRDTDLCFDKDPLTFGTMTYGEHKYFNSGSNADAWDKGMVAFQFENLCDDNTVIKVNTPTLFWKAALKAMTGWTVIYGVTSPGSPYADMMGTEVQVTQNGGSIDENRAFASNIFNGSQQTLDLSSYTHGVNVNGGNVQVKFKVFVSKESGTDPGAVGDMLDIYETFMRFPCTVPFRTDDEVWVSGDGERIGSVISARSGNPATSAINTIPAFQIENILRNKLGVASGLIDTASFDAAYAENSSLRTQFALDEHNGLLNSADVIQKICENSDLVFHFDGVGKARLLSIIPTPPGTTNATIHYSDLLFLRVKYSDMLNVANKRNVKYDYDRGKSEYQKTVIHEDSASQTAYGVRETTVELEWARPQDVEDTELPAALDNLMLNPKRTVEFETLGFKHINLELGDWVDFKAEEIDAQLKLFGSSWSGQKFQITGKVIKSESVEFTGILI